jgi:TolB-like protein/DNA-binding winged helix-turn-helix (wHTH) protein/Tfp pilus assembly protein PilF
MPSLPLSQLVHFDNFELDLRAGELRKAGIRIRLQEQPLLILQALLESPGEVITREELQKRIWPADTFVDFDHGLHAAVNRLRAALNDSADSPRYVETVARRGYRFIGRVDSPPPIPAPPVHDPPPSPKPRPKVWNSWTGALAGFGIATLIAAGLFTGNIYGLRGWLLGTSSRHQFRSLAVLPLDNLTGDSKQDYFADQMTEDLITQFSKLGDLKVISHTSIVQYKGTRKPLPQIAAELHVDAVVEGAVQLVGDRVRITAQLVDGATDEHIWAETYDRDMRDVLLLQNEVAGDIAKQIDLRLTPQQQQRLHASAHPVDPDAYQAYLLGRYYWNMRTADGLEKAGKYFAEAIQKDPNFALAYSGQADYFAYLTVLGGPEVMPPDKAMKLARTAASKALELDDNLAEAHASMGNILHNYDWNWDGAEREFKRAIALNPNYAMAHHLYAHLLIETGRGQESQAEARRALELDPYSPFINNGVARLYYLSREYEKAIAQCRVGLQISPTYIPARIQLALAYEQTGKLNDAISELEQAAAMIASASQNGGHPVDLPVLHALLGHAYAIAGRTPDAMNELSKLQASANTRYIPASYFGILWMGLGNKNQAFTWLNRGLQERSEHMLYLGIEPLVDPLHNDPRFDALLRKVGLNHPPLSIRSPN